MVARHGRDTWGNLRLRRLRTRLSRGSFSGMLLSTIPRTGAEIIAALGEVHRESVAYWATCSDTEFFAPLGTAWSPAENVRHLSKSVRAVQQGLRLPPIVVHLIFGTTHEPARSYETIRTIYLERLAQGASAGRFAPEPKPAPANPTAERARIMRVHAASVEVVRGQHGLPCAATSAARAARGARDVVLHSVPQHAPRVERAAPARWEGVTALGRGLSSPRTASRIRCHEPERE